MIRLWLPVDLRDTHVVLFVVINAILVTAFWQHPAIISFLCGGIFFSSVFFCYLLYKLGFHISWRRENVGTSRVEIRDFISPIALENSYREVALQGSPFCWSRIPLIIGTSIAYWPYLDVARALLTQSKLTSTKIKKALVLGGAGCSLPKLLVNLLPNVQVDVVEKSSEMILLSKQYFIPHETRITLKYDDAFSYVEQTTTTYDLVIIDIFNDEKLDERMKNVAFIQGVKSLLSKEGEVIINLGFADNVQAYTAQWLKHFPVSQYRYEKNVVLSSIPLKENSSPVQTLMS